MENDLYEPKSRWRLLLNGSFFLGMLAGFGIGVTVDNLFIAGVLVVALGVAWYVGKRTGKKKEAEV